MFCAWRQCGIHLCGRNLVMSSRAVLLCFLQIGRRRIVSSFAHCAPLMLLGAVLVRNVASWVEQREQATTRRCARVVLLLRCHTRGESSIVVWCCSSYSDSMGKLSWEMGILECRSQVVGRVNNDDGGDLQRRIGRSAKRCGREIRLRPTRPRL